MSTTIITEANLTADPELRYTKVTGQAVCSLRLAISTRRKNMDGDYVDTTFSPRSFTILEVQLA